jgi:hypothetical protein
MAILAKISTESEKRGFRFPSFSIACALENGGTSVCRGNRCLDQRFPKDNRRENGNAQADPPEVRGRPPPGSEPYDSRVVSSAPGSH